VRRAPIVLVTAVLAGLLLLPACAARVREAAAGPRFPDGARQAATLDIQARQGATTIVLLNTSARSFGASRLWLNAWYSAEIEGLGIGETVTIPLRSFRDEHGTRPQAGGFFALRDPLRVVQAQIEDQTGLFGLVVVDVGER
jgi:hypothetical protein